MIRKKNWASWLVLLFMTILVAIGGESPIAYADSKYTVTKGNTLWGIAQTHHTSVTALIKENHLTTTLLQINQSLWIPDSSEQHLATPHGVFLKKQPRSTSQLNRVRVRTVQPGDTLWNLAVENHTSVPTLIQINHLSSPLLHSGQKLKVYQPGQKLVVYQPSRKTSPSTNRTYFHINYQTVNQMGIPVQLIPIYQAAGNQYGIPWAVLAAIHRQETDFSMQPIVSSAGAEGPMQFMPATFAQYAVTAPECNGAPNINNVYDAIYTTAHMLACDGYARNPIGALYQYNHSMAYVAAIQALAAAYQL